MKHKENAACEAAVRGTRYLYFKEHGVISILKWLIASMAFVDFRSIENSNSIFFFSKRVEGRTDLSDMQESFFSSIEPRPKPVNGRYRINLNLLADLTTWSRYYFTQADQFVITPKTITSKVVTFLSGLHFYSSVTRLRNNVSNIYVFCDSVGLDAAISKLYRTKGATVCSIQHGQYRFEPTILNSDLVPFLNPCGTKILVWGEVTKNEYIRSGVDGYEIEVSGKFQTSSPAIAGHDRIEYLCVVLNGPDSSNVNKSLIEFATEFSKSSTVRILIKKHPADKSQYSFPLFTIEQEINSIFLCHSSGFIVDSLLAQRRFVVLLNELTPNVYRGLSCLVKTKEDLLSLIEHSSTKYWENLFRQNATRFVKNA